MGKKVGRHQSFFFLFFFFSNRNEKLQPETELLFKCSRPCYELNPQVHLIWSPEPNAARPTDWYHRVRGVQGNGKERRKVRDGKWGIQLERPNRQLQGKNKIKIQGNSRVALQTWYKYSRTNRTSTRGHLNFPRLCSNVSKWGRLLESSLWERGWRNYCQDLFACYECLDRTGTKGLLGRVAGIRYRSPGWSLHWGPLFCWRSPLIGQRSTSLPRPGRMKSICRGEWGWRSNEYQPTSLQSRQL